MKPNSSKIAIVVSLFNSKITLALLDSVLKTLKKAGTPEDNLRIIKVPGAFELPSVCARLARKKDFSCVIAIGAIIRGDTPHFEYISSEVTRGLMALSIETEKPVIMGVLTTETEKQALERCKLGAGENKNSSSPHSIKNPVSDKGVEFAQAALTMIDIFKGEL